MKKVYWIIGIMLLGIVIFGQHRKIRNLRFGTVGKQKKDINNLKLITIKN